FFPATDWVLGLNLNFQEDDYPNSEMGLRYARIQDATLDASYVPSEQVNTYAFYTVQRSQFEQNGRSHNPFAAGSETDPTRNWRVDFDEWTHTVGVGSSLTFLENRLTWSTDYSFS
ncbi:MAG: MtrB/PioB family outer membrane beta-barrel protein, partial [Nitrospinaceae bacterium]|nr:MtrB/PioB family outer membrane beta-barrel protein [Nitrospinaceae bacterium]NIR54106.1 MtrB/PioB family outer membrane beta-barrel protein [Nitrospinaceae bacterium]NIS84525.1 MtrB/PioB family outer membrane beta-barrel protein [Nitrospinaceae bacterium]NIT81337.1 MtrB/PioB family outer membrane beta-barrel protein [Nitrospinaceae bacterium]NIU43606.1 MtrB/PioB family outer membrane beta-barrel protein [Nitrospinaceae bacterium]